MDDPRYPGGWQPDNIYEILRQHAATRPDAEALVEGNLRLSLRERQVRLDSMT